MNGMFPMQNCGCGQPPMGSSFGGGYPGLNPGFGQFGGDPMGVNNSMMAMGQQQAQWGNMMTQMMDVMGMMLNMFMMKQMQTMMSSMANFGGGGAAGGTPGVGNFLGGSSPAASGGGGGGGGAPGGVAPSGGAAPAAGNAQAASPVNIGAGTRVLEIGDSHTVGTFGQELDAKLRGTGAQVSTYASAGANPSDFVNGTGHKYGYWEKHADGSEKKAGYGTNAAPPKLESLIASEKPHVIVVNLGANFRSGNPKAEVDKIGAIAKKHNIPLVWVGPPKTAQDNSNPASIQAFDQKMAEAMAPYGKYIPSSNLTPKYSGGDGIHYGGAEGNKTAKQWANGVFNAITGR